MERINGVMAFAGMPALASLVSLSSPLAHEADGVRLPVCDGHPSNGPKTG